MSAPVPFLDVGAGYRELAPELDAAARRVLSSGHYVLGPEVEAFEREFAAFCGTSHCAGVASGLDALELSLRALGVGPGDEVIVPGNTYIATWLAVSAVGARPVPVEPDPATANVDAAAVAPAIGPRTRAVIAVHLYGRAVEAGPLLALCREHGIALVEDAAQAHGALRDGARAGALGDIAAFSFYPGKNLGAYGDGGAVVTADAGIAERVRVLRNYGAREKYRNDVRGLNSRLDPLQAAMLSVKLVRLHEWNARRRALAERYVEQLEGVDGLVLPPLAGEDHVWHLFVVRTAGRDALAAALRRDGIETLVHYPVPPHLQRAYADLGVGPGALPVSETLADTVLSLPLGPHLSLTEVDRVAGAVRAALRFAPGARPAPSLLPAR